MKPVILTLALAVPVMSYADTAQEIEALIQKNMTYTESENVEAVMSTMHSDSLYYQATVQMLQQLFSVHDLSYTLMSYKFVAEEGGYAYARIIQRTEKVEGPDFRDNDLESLQVFKQEDGEWKLWSQANLRIEYL
ncbi:nuclear transport factor 2 family protein [Rhodanobacter aciditrophus]|uniref:Nuclear transport factor 2 family protein n=1 Tax=Rhodanobacter aciditrophus TaxID=1623218 RepID=A0ABW4AXX2_9GAMM